MIIKLKSMLSFILIISLISTMFICTIPEKVYGDIGIGTSSQLKKGPDLSGSQVYFGSSDGSTKWYVVDEDKIKDTVTLFSTDSRIIDIKLYNLNTSKHENWSGSDLCKWLNSEYTNSGNYSAPSFLNDKFTINERESIAPYGVTESFHNYSTHIDCQIVADQKIVIPSYPEIFGTYTDTGSADKDPFDYVQYNGTWNISKNKLLSIDSRDWWLRTPYYSNSQVFIVSKSKGSPLYALVNQNMRNVLPALKLDLASVIFTSAAEGGKSPVLGSNLSATKNLDGELKLTLYDNDLDLNKVTPTAVTTDGEISFDYGGATAGLTLSAVVMENDSVKQYGNLLANTDVNGSSEVTIPVNYNVGNDTLKLFVEQLNGDKNTDYASTTVDIDIDNHSAPTGITTSACTRPSNDDGILVGASSDMEYRKSSSSSWLDISGTSVPNLQPGEYEVRYKHKVDGGIVYIDNNIATFTVDSYTAPQPTPPAVKKYTVTLDSNGGKMLSNNKLTVTKGDKYGKLSTPKRIGYKFKGWYTAKSGGAKITSNTNANLTKNQTLYAQWTANKYKVTFIGNKGKIKKSNKYKTSKLSKHITYDKKYGSLPNAKRTGYKFKGWYTKKNDGKNVTKKTVMKSTKSTKLYAKWTPNAKIVNCKWVRLRKAPGNTKIIKGYIKKGTKVSIISKVKVNKTHTWHKIRVGKKTGYIYSKYVKSV